MLCIIGKSTMDKVTRYIKTKNKYFIFLYIWLFSFITLIDSNSAFSCVVYTVGLFLICENAQVDFDFSSRYEQSKKFRLIQLLPLKRREYQKKQTIFVICFILLNTGLLFLVRYFGPNYYRQLHLIRTTDVIYLVQYYWVFITILYLAFHIWENYFAKELFKIIELRKTLLIVCVFSSVIGFLFSIPGQYSQVSQLSGINSILFITVSILFFTGLIYLAIVRSNQRNMGITFKLSKSRIKNIIKLSSFEVGKTSNNMIYLGGIFIGITFSSGDVVHLFSAFMIISFGSLLNVVQSNVSKYYRKGSLLNILPFSKREIFISSLVNMVLDWLVYLGIMILVLLAYGLIQNRQFIFNISIGNIFYAIYFHLLSFSILLKIFLDRNGYLYIILGLLLLFVSVFFFNFQMSLFNSNIIVGIIVSTISVGVLLVTIQKKYRTIVFK